MFDANTDPLGTALQARARQKRIDYMNGPGFGHISTILPSNAWDGYTEALDEAHVKGLADQSVGEKKGMFDARPQSPTTAGPGQTSAVETMPSNQVGVRGNRMATGVYGHTIPSMDSLFETLGLGKPKQGAQ